MALENPVWIEQTLDLLGAQLHDQLAGKNYAAAKMTFLRMKTLTGGCKLRLLAIMCKLSPGAASLAGRREMEVRAAKAIEEVLIKEEQAKRTAMLIRVFGKGVVPKFFGAAGLLLLAKDLFDGANYVSNSIVEQMALNRIAQYDDFLTENENTPSKIPGYKEWLATEYYPGRVRRNSEFWRNMKSLFPQGIPG